EMGADGAGPMGDHAGSRTHKLVFDSGEAVMQNSPLWRGHNGVPGVVNVAKIDFLFCVEIVIDPEKILTPGGEWRDGGVIAGTDGRVAAGSCVGRGNQTGVQDGL